MTSRPHPATVLAAVLVALEGVAIAVLAGWQVLALIGGDIASVTSAVALLVLTVVLMVGVFAFAWGISRGHTWGRSGGIVTQVLTLAIALGAATGAYAHPLIGLAIAAPAVVAFIAIVISARHDTPTSGPEAPGPRV